MNTKCWTGVLRLKIEEWPGVIAGNSHWKRLEYVCYIYHCANICLSLLFSILTPGNSSIGLGRFSCYSGKHRLESELSRACYNILNFWDLVSIILPVSWVPYLYRSRRRQDECVYHLKVHHCRLLSRTDLFRVALGVRDRVPHFGSRMPHIGDGS